MRYTFLSIASAFVLLFCIGCSTGKPITDTIAMPMPGMFKVAILYPNGEGKTFDMEYYEQKHMPMVAGFIGKNLKFYEIDKGLPGRSTMDKMPFLAIGYFYVSDTAEYNKAIAQNRDAVVNDFKNYTNVQPVVQLLQIRQVKTNQMK